MKKNILIPLIFYCCNVLAQQATPASERMTSFETKKKALSESPLKNLAFRSVGPTIMSGRVTDLDVNENTPEHFYVAYASGGLWETKNNGQSFEPLFDHEASMTIGDIAVNWKHGTLWVGTGENNSSRSSYAGTGIYKSVDGGKTWNNKGLIASHHIARIILHPTDTNTLYVAVLGNLYSKSDARGIYKSTDGGNSWKKTLFISNNAGAIDLVMDPNNSDVLYAATWERERKAWDFKESGKASGIYKSIDAGENWKLVSGDKSGFPSGDGVGRIGLAMSGNIIYAVLDNQFRRSKEEKDNDKYLKNDFRNMTKENFLKLDQKKLKDFLEENAFPKEYSAEKLTTLIKENTITPNTLFEYLEDANSLLFDTPVIGIEVYRSNDGGINWKKTHEDFLDKVYFSYGYYFGQIRVAPNNPEMIIISGVPILKSINGGKKFEGINGDNVHVDHHALWINPKNNEHLILGNDGGINISYDGGKNWQKANTPPVGQFYTVAVDNEKIYNVYGGLQDNGVWYGPNDYEYTKKWQEEGQYPYKRLLGGDGMQVAVDLRDNNIVYTGFQFGNYYRINKNTNERKRIRVKHQLGERPLRYNWQSPIHLSIHQQDVLYMGSNKFHRSLNQGDDFETLSGDLTQGGKKGDVPFGTLSSIHESPLKFGLLYAGSDDGLVHVSKDGGNNWENNNKGLPKNLWVSRVLASEHQLARVYLCLNGYRNDDFNAYVYVSENYGKSWKRIGTALPREPVNVLLEDPENENVLYLGTDNGLYISLDRGKTFIPCGKDLPFVAVHDLAIQKREKELLVATHGRSLYIADISPIQQLKDSILNKALHVFKIPATTENKSWGKEKNEWFPSPSPTDKIIYYSSNSGDLNLKVKYKNIVLYSKPIKADKGINYIEYDFSIDSSKVKAFNEVYDEKSSEKEQQQVKLRKDGKHYILPGIYTLELTNNVGDKTEEKYEIKENKKQ